MKRKALRKRISVFFQNVELRKKVAAKKIKEELERGEDSEVIQQVSE